MKIILAICFSIISTIIYSQQYFINAEESEFSFWKLKQVNGKIELDSVRFPNTIHEILFQKGIIQNPYYGINESKLKWIEDSDWEATTQFELKDSIEGLIHRFCFEGIEPFAKVYLNGQFLFESVNAFYPYEFNVTKFLKFNSKNELKIAFDSPVRRSKELQSSKEIYLPGDERVYVRKSQYEFGWDWGPRFITTGIRKKLTYYKSHYSMAEIKNVHLKTLNLSNELAEIVCEIEIYSNIEQTQKLNIDNFRGNENLLNEKIKFKKGLNKIIRKVIIKNPLLWWPNGMGSPETYNINFELYYKLNRNWFSNSSANVVYALCDIKLVKEKDPFGNSFYFTVNGEKCYLKGFNLIPQDHFVNEFYYDGWGHRKFFSEKESDGSLPEQLREMNVNAIRIWGGGVYPNENFLKSCLANGIIVWQDFMFAGGMYPGDSSFLKNVEEEITFQVKRLRNYNNIALYCGNNEIDEAWHNWGWQKQYNYSKEDSTKIWKDYLKLFHELIPSIVKKYDSDTDYIPSSPEIGWGRKESMTQGDSHYWGVWWGKEPIETFEEKIPRFMSEFGMQAMPDLSTLRKVIPDSLMNFDSPEFKNHQKHPTGFETLNYYLEKYLTVPTDMGDYVYATQLLQAITLEKAIKAQRMSEKCMGTLIWQLNDTWPVTSWSVMDSEGEKKLAFNYVSKSFSDFITNIEEDENNYYITAVSERNKENESVKININVKDLDNASLLDTTIQVITKNHTDTIFVLEKTKYKFDVKRNYIVVSPQISNNSFPDVFFLDALKNIQFQIPELIFNTNYSDNLFSKVYVTPNTTLHYVDYFGGSAIRSNYWEKGQTWEFIVPNDELSNSESAIDYVKKNLKSINHLLGK